MLFSRFFKKKNKVVGDVIISFKVEDDIVYPDISWTIIDDKDDLQVKVICEKIYNVCTACLSHQTVQIMLPKIVQYGESNKQFRVAKLMVSILENYLKIADKEESSSRIVNPRDVFSINKQE